MHVGLNLHQFARCFWDVLSIWYAFPISVWLVVGIGLAVATHYWGAKKLQPGFPNHMIAAQPAIISFWFYIISLHPVFNPQFSPVSPSFLMVKSSRCWSHQVLGWSPLGAMFFRTQSEVLPNLPDGFLEVERPWRYPYESMAILLGKMMTSHRFLGVQRFETTPLDIDDDP